MTLGETLGLGSSRARAISDELEHRLPKGASVAVFGETIARELGRRGLQATLVVETAKSRVKVPQLVAAPGSLPFADQALDGVYAGLGSPSAPLGELARVVRDGGLVALAQSGLGLSRKPSPADLAAQMIHTLLIDIEQLQVGGALITLGRVRR